MVRSGSEAAEPCHAFPRGGHPHCAGMGQRASHEPALTASLSACGKLRSPRGVAPGSSCGRERRRTSGVVADDVSTLLALNAELREARAQLVADVLLNVEAALDALDGAEGDAAAAARDELTACELRLQTERDEDEDADDGEEDDEGAQLDSFDRSMRLQRFTSQAVLDRVATASCTERAWLLGTFTSIDLEASNNHHALGAIHSAARSSCRARTIGRMKTDERGLLTRAALASPSVACMMDNAEDLEFDAMEFCSLPEVGNQPITVLGTYLCQTCGLIFEMQAQGQVADNAPFERRFLSFLGKVDGMYKVVPYHNGAHAVNVMNMMAWLLSSGFFADRTTPLDRFMSIVAAAVHDVAHPGVTNLFLSKTMSALALRYNDVAVLENMHVATAFETMQADDRCNWLKLLEEASLRNGISAQPRAYVRRGLISMVLATDLSKHAKHQTGLERFPRPQPKLEAAEPVDEAERIHALDQHLFVLGAALHAADLGHACKPRDQMLAWSQRVVSEFWAQGDEERQLGIGISPLCDRESDRSTIPKAQLGFFRFVVQPYFEALAELIPHACPACEELEKNRILWEEKDGERATYEQLFDKDAVSD